MSDYDEVTEVLARGWIECDPNRGGEPGSGFHPDDTIPPSYRGGSHEESQRLPDTELTGKPVWHWFIPRADALRDWLDQNGLEIRPKK